MAREALLDRGPLPPENIHRIHGEDDPPHAAAAYARELQSVFGGDADRGRTRGPPLGPATGFDLILLGMGGDNAHTASLFPVKAAVREQVRWVMAEYIDEVAMWRVTLTPVVINAAKNVTSLVAGAGKAEPRREVLQGPFEPDRLPAQVVQPTHGQLTWLVDQAAASGMLPLDTTSAFR
jgi:6-phosphogluconolactonase